jgi:hypothetical protein
MMHVAFDTSSLFWKMPSIRKMRTNAVACRKSIRRFKRADYQLIDQLNFVKNKILKKKVVPGTELLARCENTQQED